MLTRRFHKRYPPKKVPVPVEQVGQVMQIMMREKSKKMIKIVSYRCLLASCCRIKVTMFPNPKLKSAGKRQNKILPMA